ncbi:MAG TPA: DUF928 domain-containing protein [Allocoleopsis sp.]
MIWIKLPVQYRTLVFMLVLGLVNFTSSPTPVSAQPAKPANDLSGLVNFELPPAPDTGAPDKTGQTGSRGECQSVKSVDTPLTALVPISKTSSGDEVVWGLTSAEYPTFWFYVPYSLTGKLSGELRLTEQDEKGNRIYKPIKVTGTAPGIIGVRLPSTEASLKIGKVYTYDFVVRCDLNDSSKNIYVTASVERRTPSPSLESQLRKATQRERAALYAKEGFWYESLTTLAELRRANPNDAGLTADWGALLDATLLKADYLNKIKQEPIVPLNQIKQEPIVP